MRSRSIHRLLIGVTVLALIATSVTLVAAVPVVAQDAAAKYSRNALDAMPKNARKVFDLVAIPDPTGDAPHDWADIGNAAFDVGKLNKQAATFLNQRPAKAGEWWGANSELFAAGDRVLVLAAQTGAPWPGDAPGGIVWSVGQDGPGAFGYYGGGHADPFSGNAVIDNFGVFDDGGTFYPSGGRTDLTGLTLGGSPEFYGESGGAGFRKGRNFVSFLPVSRGASTFDAALRVQSDGSYVYDYLAPGMGRHRHAFDGSGLPDGLDCFSVGLFPRSEPLDPTPTGFDIELSLSGSEAFLAELQSGGSHRLLQGPETHWSFPGSSGAFATATVGPNPEFEGALLDALGLTSPPIFDPARAGFAFGDPDCGRRMTDVPVCGQGLDLVLRDLIGALTLPTEHEFDFPDGSNGCAFFLDGAQAPFAALSVGSRPFSRDDLVRQREGHASCGSADLDLGEGAFLLVCGDIVDPVSLIWQDYFEEENERLPYRVSLELLDPSVFPLLPETVDTILAAGAPGDLPPLEDYANGLGPFAPSVSIPATE